MSYYRKRLLQELCWFDFLGAFSVSSKPRKFATSLENMARSAIVAVQENGLSRSGVYPVSTAMAKPGASAERDWMG
mgnify:CR=1 FL=1